MESDPSHKAGCLGNAVAAQRSPAGAGPRRVGSARLALEKPGFDSGGQFNPASLPPTVFPAAPPVAPPVGALMGWPGSTRAVLGSRDAPSRGTCVQPRGLSYRAFVPARGGRLTGGGDEALAGRQESSGLDASRAPSCWGRRASRFRVTESRVK